MIQSNISRNRKNGTYKVSFSGLSKAHLQALTSVLGMMCPLDIEVHSYNGVDLPFMHLETFCPLADINKSVLSTQYSLLRDIAQCFTSEPELPKKEKLYSFSSFRPLGYEY